MYAVIIYCGQRRYAVIRFIAFRFRSHSVAAQLRVDEFHVHLRGALHRIFDELKIAVFPTRHHRDILNLVGYRHIFFAASHQRVGAPFIISYSTVILTVLLFNACVSHKLRLLDESEPVMLVHHRKQFTRGIIAKLTCQKSLQMLLNTGGGNSFDVPRHIHEKLYLVFRRFYVAHIQDPYPVYAVLISAVHLMKQQIGAERAKPQIVMRAPPVRDMIVNAVAPTTRAFRLGWKMPYISVIVVTPHQRHIIRHLQSGIIDVKNLLIRDKHLWHFRHIVIHILLQ